MAGVRVTVSLRSRLILEGHRHLRLAAGWNRPKPAERQLLSLGASGDRLDMARRCYRRAMATNLSSRIFHHSKPLKFTRHSTRICCPDRDLLSGGHLRTRGRQQLFSKRETKAVTKQADCARKRLGRLSKEVSVLNPPSVLNQSRILGAIPEATPEATPGTILHKDRSEGSAGRECRSFAWTTFL